MICPVCKSECDEYGVCPNCKSKNNDEPMICPYCGKTIRFEEEICPRCGRELAKKKIFNGLRNEYVAYTPKYVVKAPFSLPAVSLIMAFMLYSLGYNIVHYISDLGGKYQSYDIESKLLKLVSTDTRPLILTLLSILSIITFIVRISINKGRMDNESLSRKLTNLKVLVLADVSSFMTYFFVSFWPSVFEHNTTLYHIGATIGMCIVIVSAITLPVFYRKSKIRTR